MDHIPEEESAEAQIIKEEWKVWNELLKSRGRPGEEGSSTESEYAFLIDRRNEPESLFTGDSITVSKIKGPLEDFTRLPANFHTDQEEEWIEIIIDPRNPFHPMIGKFKERNHDFYFTDRLTVQLSNFGRALEDTDW